jgi:hypothetical protein
VPTDDQLTDRVAAPPRPPDVPNLFASNTSSGGPGIHPQATAIAPAAGPPVAAPVRLVEYTNDPLDEVRERSGVVPVRVGL